MSCSLLHLCTRHGITRLIPVGHLGDGEEQQVPFTDEKAAQMPCRSAIGMSASIRARCARRHRSSMASNASSGPLDLGEGLLVNTGQFSDFGRLSVPGPVRRPALAGGDRQSGDCSISGTGPAISRLARARSASRSLSPCSCPDDVGSTSVTMDTSVWLCDECHRCCRHQTSRRCCQRTRRSLRGGPASGGS